MTAIKNNIFGPMLPKMSVELLPDSTAAFAQNLRHVSGALDGWGIPATVPGMTMPGSSLIKTLYRFGKDTASKTNYWFQFTGDVNIVKGPVNTDTEERTYWTDGVYPKKTKASIAGLSAGSSITPASLRMGVPPPGWAGDSSPNTFTPVASVQGVATDPASTPTTSTYVITYVTTWGEESMPGNPSNIVTWRAGQNVAITCPGAYSGAYDINRIRLYRSSTGTSRTTFQKAGERPVGTANHYDTLLPAQLGEVCPTWDFAPPADGMIGLTDLGNGILAAFEKNTISFCEPNYPYAWPGKYDLTVSAPIVGMKVFGQTLVVGTTDGIVLVSGVDPSSMSMDTPKGLQSCVSKRSMVEMMVGAVNGVVYAGPDGLMLISGSGHTNLTDRILSKDEWVSYAPSTIDGYTIDGRYYAFYDNGGTQACLIFSFGEDAGMVACDQYITAGYSEERSDALFVVQRVSTTNTLKEWGVGARAAVTWRSKDYNYYSGVCMARAMVVARAYPVTFKLYSDGVLRHTQTVTNAFPFTLPDGRASKIAYQIESTNIVTDVRIATSARELGNG